MRSLCDTIFDIKLSWLFPVSINQQETYRNQLMGHMWFSDSYRLFKSTSNDDWFTDLTVFNGKIEELINLINPMSLCLILEFNLMTYSIYKYFKGRPSE